MNYYVETYRPAYPQKGVMVRAIREAEYNRDCLAPTMTSVWFVRNVNTKEEAIATVIEAAAGKNTGYVTQTF